MSRILTYAVATLLVMLPPSVLTAQERPSPATVFVQAEPVALLEAPPVGSLDSSTTPSLSRHLLVGTAAGAGAGLLAVGAVLLMCGEWCTHDRPLVISLYTAGGAALGAAGGALVWAARR